MMNNESKNSVGFEDVRFLEKILPAANLMMLVPIVGGSQLEWYIPLITLFLFTVINVALSKLESSDINNSRFSFYVECFKTIFCFVYLGSIYLVLKDPAPYWLMTILPIIRSYCVIQDKRAFYLSFVYILSSLAGIFLTFQSYEQLLLPGSCLVIFLVLFHFLLNYFKEEVEARKKGETNLALANQKLKTELEERLRLESQLLRTQKLESIGQLAAGIAHEINTPIQFVGNNIQFIEGSIEELIGLLDSVLVLKQSNYCLSKTEQENISLLINKVDWEYLRVEIPKALKESNMGIERVSKIIKAVKEFSYPGAPHKTFHNLNKAIENTLVVCRNEWCHVAELKMDMDPNLPSVPCVIDEINQVILNLVVNATHALKNKKTKNPEFKGQIKVTTSTEAGYAIIHIIDNGTGIPVEIQNRIFDPFFTNKKVGEGTGMGLSVTRDIIFNKHSGQLDFKTSEGEGAEFIIQLPLQNQGDSQASS